VSVVILYCTVYACVIKLSIALRQRSSLDFGILVRYFGIIDVIVANN